MAFPKRQRRGRFYRRRRRFRRRARGGVRSYMRRAQETKFSQINLADQQILDYAAPYEASLCFPAVGTGQQGRIGSSVIVTGLWMKLFWRARTSAVKCRIIVYIPKVVTDSMETDGYTTSTIVDLDKYTVLSDRKIGISNSVGPVFMSTPFRKSFTRGGRVGMHVRFVGNTTNYAKNDIRLFMVSDEGTSGSGPLCDITTQCFFKDS